MGLKTEIGRTSKGGSSALREESPAPTAEEDEEEAPSLRAPSRGAALWRARRFPFHAPLLLSQHLQARPKLSPCRLRSKGLLKTDGEEDLGAGRFMRERGEDLRK